MSAKHRAPHTVAGAGKTGSTNKRTGVVHTPFRINEAQLRTALKRLETNYAQLEQTRSQLSAIIEASPDAMLFLTPDGRPTGINMRFTDFFGLEDTIVLSQVPDQLLCLLSGVFLPNETGDDWLSWSITDQEHVFRAKEVRTAVGDRVLELSSLPVHNVDLSYLGRLYSWHDVTQERNVERMKSDIISMVSHDIRAPLTSIQGYADALLTEQDIGELSEVQRAFLVIIQNNARRVVSLTNDLLDLSRLEAGMMKVHLEALDLNQLIADLTPSFQRAWDTKQQRFTVHLLEHIPPVLGDADRVTQILSNLLSNAHKYTPEAGHIGLSVETVGPCVCIAVSDSGIGLSTEEQVHLFTRFYRVHNAATQGIDGTGLGLSITRALVEMQGGEIQVTSEPGHGSTFRFTLPLA